MKEKTKGDKYMSSKVYFTKTITPAKVLELYKLLGKELTGNVAIKVHSGEPGNQIFLQPEFWKVVVDHVGGTIVECNTAYDGQRNDTQRHRAVFKKHGWEDCFGSVDLLDAAGPDLVLPVPNGKVIKQNYVGKDMANYDATLVLSHFKGNAVYINVMKNMSVDCDCCAVAEDPAIADIGMLISLDPVAIDQACLDLVYASKDPGRDHLIERIETRNGVLTVEAAAELGIGSREYELIEVE